MYIEFDDAPIAKFLFGNTKVAWVWFLARLYVGYEWIMAGWNKISNPAWVGSDAGKALSGFVQGALEKTQGAHPDVQGWYATFLKTVVLSHPALWSHLVAYGEVLIGIALILGIFTGIAAGFGLFMNLNFLLAGAVSLNPVMFVIEIFLVLAWKTAGYIGFDRIVLKHLGTFWQPGTLFISS